MLAAIYRGDARPSPQRRRWRRRSAQPAVRCWLALAAYWRRRSAQPAVRRWPAPAAAALAATLGPARSGVRRWRRRSVSPSPPAVAGSEARPSPQSAALAATLGAARRRPPWPAPASVALACMAPAATLGAATLPSQPAAVARDDARHARDRGAGGDARRWELTVALPGLRPQRRWRGEPATFGVALPACSGGGDARPSPRLRRWRQRSTHQLAVALPVARARSGGAGGDARRSSPSLSLARTRSGGAGAATLGVALPACSGGGDAWPSPRLRRWRRCVGDAEQLAVALPTPPAQRRRRRSAQLTPAAPTATRRTARSPSQARARGAAWRWKQRSPCVVPCAAPCSALCLCCSLSILSSILFCLLFCPLSVLPPAALLCILFLWLLCGWLHSRHKSCSPALARPVAGGARPGCPRN
jgi:hypothetical protein